MNDTKKHKTLSDALRETMIESGVSLNRIWLDTGVRLRSLQRFRDGDSIALTTADKLADYFGLTLVKKEEEDKK
ncbi:MAG: hypothetical protein GX130_05305 [Candidatus Hydrogenedens sp.]|jgi:plasmid maintenance system antidote protein VapI|nr:hypothetical protein [Candidatus Hydrogenedens sp.]